MSLPKRLQKPQAATRGDGGSSAGCTWPVVLYPPWPLRCCRASLGRAGLVSSPDADWCLFSHTVPDDPDRRYVSLDRCSPAMYVYARAGLGRTKHDLDPPLSISSLAIATPLVGLAGL